MEKTTKLIGDEGEDKALKYLISNGYFLVEKNYRYKRNEIDLIMKSNDVLIFVEVKYRKSNQFGFPETFVDAKKIQRLEEAAEYFTYSSKWKGNIRFDIIAINKIGDIAHFKDIS